jgi:aspartate/methionine/tyrosine aminotransferase
VVVSVLCNPPQPGDPSYELFEKERSDEFASLQRRAKLVSDAFNSLPNMSVVPTAAAMYAFPEVRGWWWGWGWGWGMLCADT